MKINEVEQLLGISKANIRFYEKQNLLSPGRTENGYRDYSNADLERLKTIIILRKLGISVQDIGSILNGEMAFQEAIRKNISDLEAQIEQLEGSLNLSRQIAQEQEESLDTCRYWEIIQQKEAQGEKFADVVSEYWSSIGYPMFSRKFRLTEGMSVKEKVRHVLFICVIFALVRTYLWKDGTLLENLLYWPLIILAGSVVTFLIFWLGKHHPKIATVLNVLLLIVCVVVLSGVIILLFYGVLRTLWNGIFG